MLKVIIDYFLNQWDTISSAPSLLAVTFIIGCAFGWFASSWAQKNKVETMEERLKLKDEQLKDKDTKIQFLENQPVSSDDVSSLLKDKDAKIRSLENQLTLKCSQLTVQEMELLTDAQQDGGIHVKRSQAGSWVRVGNKDFLNLEDKAYTAKYLDALDSLLEKKLVKHDRGQWYPLTSTGFETARKQRQHNKM
ncbi:MAG: LapA family protein [Myxacorys chilensis ATA2-1-KO14]|jgi:uncharacterized protein YjhX (UPF0386 family)/uncharacterized membrane protein YciS (DUF1049 family)|nr:LapA family protein [Myxacorys chilensis ATA2-1-KO14]